MHINVWPSALSGQETYPVTKRSVLVQPPMVVKHFPEGQQPGMPLPSLVQELCVLP